MSRAFLLLLIGVVAADADADPKIIQPKPKTMALSMTINFYGAKKDVGEHLGEEFQRRMVVFSECGHGDYSDAIRLTVSFRLTKAGQFSDVKTVGSAPKKPQFVDCFMKKIKEIKLSPPKRDFKGKLSVKLEYVDKQGLNIQKSPTDQPKLGP